MIRAVRAKREWGKEWLRLVVRAWREVADVVRRRVGMQREGALAGLPYEYAGDDEEPREQVAAALLGGQLPTCADELCAARAEREMEPASTVVGMGEDAGA